MHKTSKFYELLSETFWYMPNGKRVDNEASRSELSKFFIKFEITESVTFFGGSFNPLHEGHLECLRLCPENNIVVVPDCNPLKIKTDLDRTKELLDLATNLREFHCNIYPAFYLAGEKNPTSSWITKVKVPEINFLMGDDSFMSLLKWINPNDIINSLTKLYVVPRIYSSTEYEDQKKKLLLINPNLKIIVLSQHAFQDLSSTKLRINQS